MLLEWVLIVVLIGVGLWALNTYIPMAQPLKTLINVVVIIAVVVWTLQLFGVFDIPFPRIRHRG